MNKKISFSLIACLTLCLSVLSFAEPSSNSNTEKEAEIDNLFEDEKAKTQAESLKQAEAERLQREEAKRQDAETAKALKEQKIKEQRMAERAKKLNSLREASADSTEYTIEPSSVEMVVELEPKGYGFRQRNHRMLLGVEGDLAVTGRGMLSYEFRFFEHLAVGIRGGVDYSKISLFSNLRKSVDQAVPEDFTALGGIFVKWRVTEWYMRTSAFLEPSILFGHMWRKMADTESKHFILRPGIFGGLETVFDSGFALTWRVGAEFPYDAGSENRIDEVAVPLFLLGLGFAI